MRITILPASPRRFSSGSYEVRCVPVSDSEYYTKSNGFSGKIMGVRGRWFSISLRPLRPLRLKPLKESGRLLDSRRGESRFLDAGDFAGVELHEGEALSAEILERCADEVELLVVDDQESIVERFAVADGELRILGVEGRDVRRGNLMVRSMFLVVVLRCEDRDFHSFAFLRKEIKCLRCRPVVDENQRSLRACNELQHQRAHPTAARRKTRPE